MMLYCGYYKDGVSLRAERFEATWALHRQVASSKEGL